MKPYLQCKMKKKKKMLSATSLSGPLRVKYFKTKMSHICHHDTSKYMIFFSEKIRPSK